MIMMVWYASDLRYPQIQAVEIKAMPAKESQNAIVTATPEALTIRVNEQHGIRSRPEWEESSPKSRQVTLRPNRKQWYAVW